MYKFIKLRDPSNEFDNTAVEHTVEADSIPELLEAFQAFLRGCDFHFNGNIELVEEDKNEL